MKRFKKYLNIILILIISLSINNSYAMRSGSRDTKTTYKSPDNLQMARLLFGGDVLPHLNFDKHALNYGSGEYNYDKIFESLSDFTNRYDYFMLNCEFTTNPNLEPSGYPMFNSNEAIFRSLSDLGVDVITTANNHCLDTGLDGLDYTIDAIKSYGMDNVGTYKDDKKYLIKDVNGIKIGILAYAEQLNGLEYLLDTDEKKAKVNTIDPLVIKDDIENIIKKGAEFVVVYPHWGEEYSSYPNEFQIKLARAMIDWGADMVIGNHPHVIQPRDEYEAIDGRKGIIYYSLGNLISNQSYKFFDGDQRVNQSVLVDAIIYKDKDSKKAKILNTTYHSIWTDSFYDDYGWLDQSYVTDQYLGGEREEFANEYMIEQMTLADEMNREIMQVIIP